ncbi:hypothetical protein HETIRDRAFT_418386 [Heterobasidion irregulare TC 32-1]|uniref:Uncharacterized protein n=1 Tax=Heterobasidion irregulare (strain TC 32-1) TaxID=747525 RepID=W4K4S8_HETIT|nr:uncharacterized protein HETIRDRAFT_418386 [Heterobasidion irregulare TC 32-1]ETW80360.1 hypothetical protein HETIRDRAFT_418386 [Heterobasidion irregulare TC 32-1]
MAQQRTYLTPEMPRLDVGYQPSTRAQLEHLTLNHWYEQATRKFSLTKELRDSFKSKFDEAHNSLINTLAADTGTLEGVLLGRLEIIEPSLGSKVRPLLVAELIDFNNVMRDRLDAMTQRLLGALERWVASEVDMRENEIWGALLPWLVEFEKQIKRRGKGAGQSPVLSSPVEPAGQDALRQRLAEEKAAKERLKRTLADREAQLKEMRESSREETEAAEERFLRAQDVSDTHRARLEERIRNLEAELRSRRVDGEVARTADRPRTSNRTAGRPRELQLNSEPAYVGHRDRLLREETEQLTEAFGGIYVGGSGVHRPRGNSGLSTISTPPSTPMSASYHERSFYAPPRAGYPQQQPSGVYGPRRRGA